MTLEDLTTKVMDLSKRFGGMRIWIMGVENRIDELEARVSALEGQTTEPSTLTEDEAVNVLSKMFPNVNIHHIRSDHGRTNAPFLPNKGENGE